MSLRFTWKAYFKILWRKWASCIKRKLDKLLSNNSIVTTKIVQKSLGLAIHISFVQLFHSFKILIVYLLNIALGFFHVLFGAWIPLQLVIILFNNEQMKLWMKKQKWNKSKYKEQRMLMVSIHIHRVGEYPINSLHFFEILQNMSGIIRICYGTRDLFCHPRANTQRFFLPKQDWKNRKYWK